jgi:lycopene cyclase domain-containing protein
MIDLAAISIPFLFSFHPKLRFYTQWKTAFAAMLCVALFFLFWDAIYTQLGVWGFNSRYILGAKVANLPVEEVLFFFCIPYSCLFTYHALGLFSIKKLPPQATKTVSYALILVLLTVGLAHYNKLYTSFTFLFTAVLLFFLQKRNAQILSSFYRMYVLILPFFFATNGILTGSFIPEEVVWYNPAENMGIRLGTIPIEDTIYGMLMLLLNVLLFEHFRRKEN